MRYFFLGVTMLFLVAAVQLTLPSAAARREPELLPPEWDPRFAGLQVTYQPASNCDDGCWRLVYAHFEDVDESNQNHNVYVRIRNENGSTLADAPWHRDGPDGNFRILTKAEPDWSDSPIWACYNPLNEPGAYSAYAGDDPNHSDVIRGMGLPQCQHVNYRLIWQWEATPTLAYGQFFPIVIYSEMQSVPTATSIPGQATPTPIATATPTVTPTSAPGGQYSGSVVQTFPNCGLTQIFGVLHDANGLPHVGARVRLRWDGGPTPFETVSGTYVRAETDASGWEFVLQNAPIDQTWKVYVVDANGIAVSPEVAVHTVSTCNPSDVNVAKVAFRKQ